MSNQAISQMATTIFIILTISSMVGAIYARYYTKLCIFLAITAVIFCIFSITSIYVYYDSFSDKVLISHHRYDLERVCYDISSFYDDDTSIDLNKPDECLKFKMKKMYKLTESLESKNESTEKLILSLNEEIIILKKEIKDTGLSYNKAINDPNSYHKLCLLQKKLAYDNQLKIIYNGTKEGVNELFIKIDEAYSDLRMIDTIGEQAAKNLYSQIDEVINNYSRFTSKDSNLTQLKTNPLEEIWQEHIK
ncbi:MAG: hypothetical protein Q7T50_00510 [Candidatus Magasanikbacteria bacterium]|nr:hypothetical protein [Candidatus Magasanikbacteria bacterium]